MQNCVLVLGILRKTTNRPDNLTSKCTILIYSVRVQFISLRVKTRFFFYYSEYKIRTLYLIFKYIFLESNPL